MQARTKKATEFSACRSSLASVWFVAKDMTARSAGRSAAGRSNPRAQRIARRCFFFFSVSTNQSDSARLITSQPGYGTSPANLTCIGHFLVCESGCLHVQAARWLVSMSCCSRCSRACSCSLHTRHVICLALPKCMQISFTVKLTSQHILRTAPTRMFDIRLLALLWSTGRLTKLGTLHIQSNDTCNDLFFFVFCV